MKIAILSDIHGNVAALETVMAHIDAWQPDQVIVNGDVVNRGADSPTCWQMVRARRAQQGWRVLGGNHETYVCKHANPVPDVEHVGVRADINKNSRWTYQQLNGHVAELAALPPLTELAAADGSVLRTTHASMRSNEDGIYPTYTDKEIQPRIAPATAVFVTSHIHVAYTRLIGQTLLVNTGATGNSVDGDTRASYAQIIWRNGQWQAQIVRLAYDRAATDRAFFNSGFMAETGPLAWLIYHEWQTARPLLLPWRKGCKDAVLNGQISLERSVSEFLEQQGIVQTSRL
ncbi:MAG: metallophosphoesterase [Chloroflexi bacterium]|nr:metallophosphoesterase [Chloroflexota bacterium]